MCNLLKISVFLLLFSGASLAQDRLSLTFNSVQVGRNLAAEYAKSLKRHTISGGIKWHINNTVQNNQQEAFRKRFYATEFWQHLGFVLGYDYALTKKSGKLIPSIFYEFQYTYSTTRNEFYSQRFVDNNGIVYYEREVFTLGPTIALENYIGLGLDIEVYDFLRLNYKIV